MTKTTPTDFPIHDLISARWSPCGFENRPVAADELNSLFEAARWAASSYNEQPWSFIATTRDSTADFEKALSCLVDGNQQWAKEVPVLVITCTSLSFARNAKSNAAAEYDLGQAVSNLSLEATSRGLSVHQMIGIFPDKARELFEVPEGVNPMTALAIGYAADPAGLPDNLRARDLAPRSRKPQSAFVFFGKWGQSK